LGATAGSGFGGFCWAHKLLVGIKLAAISTNSATIKIFPQLIIVSGEAIFSPRFMPFIRRIRNLILVWMRVRRFKLEAIGQRMPTHMPTKSTWLCFTLAVQ
jgi:hypothetical protein